MKLFTLKRAAVYLFAGSILVLASCKKDRMPYVAPKPSSTIGVYALCEGSYGLENNSSITYYDVNTGAADPNYFKTKNGIDLGTDANDLQQYGSKMYCVVTGSKDVGQDAYLEVINIATGKSIKRIAFYDNNGDFNPRYVAFYKNNAYVSSYDGYVRKIDTTSLTIDSKILVGGALEGMAIVNSKLYVTNSNQPLFPHENKTSVSVVDLNSFIKTTDITVGFNPTKIAATPNGELYTIISGKYGDPNLLPALDKLNSITDIKTQTYTYNLSTITIAGDKGYVITNDFPSSLKNFNISTGVIGTNFISDATIVSSLYGVTVNTLNNDVFVSDATDYTNEGKMFCFGADGKKKFEFATGIVPKSAVFNYSYK